MTIEWLLLRALTDRATRATHRVAARPCALPLHGITSPNSC